MTTVFGCVCAGRRVALADECVCVRESSVHLRALVDSDGGGAGSAPAPPTTPPDVIAFNCFFRLFTHPADKPTHTHTHTHAHTLKSHQSRTHARRRRRGLTEEGGAGGGPVHTNGAALPNEVKPAHLHAHTQ